MDAVEFVRAKRRMCKSHTCDQCEIWKSEIEPANVFCHEWMGKNAEKAVAFVEQWSKEHPIKTRQSVFLEQWSEAEIDKNGCLMLCPITVSVDRRNRHEDCTTLKCTDCRREFWMQEVE